MYRPSRDAVIADITNKGHCSRFILLSTNIFVKHFSDLGFSIYYYLLISLFLKILFLKMSGLCVNYSKHF